METNQAVFADTYWSASSSRHFFTFFIQYFEEVDEKPLLHPIIILYNP